MQDERQRWRALKDAEAAVLGFLLSREFPGRDELVVQSQSARVSEIDREGSLQFRVTAPLAPVETRVPTEAHYLDGTDDEYGPAVHILLHVVDGKLSEVEIFKNDDSEIITGPYAVALSHLRFF